MCWLCDFLTSSIGKKLQVALAGLFLCLFLVTHLAGNLLLWAGPDAFNHYAKFLESQALLPVAEFGLLFLFLLHIITALWVRWENRKARPIGYQSHAWAGGRTVSSASMLYTGLIVLVFVIIHVKTMKFESAGNSLYEHVLDELKEGPASAMAIFYLAAMLALGVHLSHGVQAAARTFGVDHPKFTPAIQRVGMAFALVIAAGFGAIAFWGGFLAGVKP